MAIVGIVLFALLLLAVPIGIALSSAAAAYIMVDPLLEPTVIFRQFFSFIGRYSLTAIPLFIFAGFLMEKTGLIRQLFSFADSLVGHLPGGFGVATVLACVLFGAISGSSVAMAAAMSVIAIPEMRRRGYPDWLSGGLVATDSSGKPALWRSRLSATVAWTSTPAKRVSSGVDTTSRLPSAVVPTNTMAFLNTSPASRPASTSTAET